jgi:hypothetical protein
MDIGPQNVLGKRPSLLDPVVGRIVKKIESVVAQPDIEIEARIGTITIDRKRMYLPIVSECILDTSIPGHGGKPVRFEFVPDIGKDTFSKIQERLEILLSGKLAESPPNPLFKINAVRQSHTVDEIYKKPTACRLSYDKTTYGLPEAEPIETIAKDHLDKMDVYSGHFPDKDDEGVMSDEAAARHPFDYRISVNRERKLDPNIVSTLNRADCQMVREKRRWSYELKAWTVDLTRVTILNQPGSEEKFEVEIELKQDLLAEQMDRRAKGKQHGAYQILTDLLFFVRDLCCVFGPTGDASGQVRTFNGYRYPELTSCEPSEDRKRKYKDVMGTDVMPLIGDYVFKILDEIRPPQPV